MDKLQVLVTRPQHQAQNLCALLKRQGVNPILFPTIAIEPVADQKLLTQHIQQLDDFNIAIFCSANAVDQIKDLLKTHWIKLPKSLLLASIGAATKTALERLGFCVSISPQHDFNSEALLAEFELQQIKNKKIIIFTGNNTRELLPLTLRSRGALITQVECYQRVQPKLDPEPVMALLQQGQLQMVICTSNEALSNLFAMLNVTGQMLLRDIQLVGVNDRIKSLARQLGCNKIPIIAKQVSDEAICAAILGVEEPILK